MNEKNEGVTLKVGRLISLKVGMLAASGMFFSIMSQPLPVLAYERSPDSSIERENCNPELPDGYISMEEFFYLGRGVSASDFSVSVRNLKSEELIIVNSRNGNNGFFVTKGSGNPGSVGEVPGSKKDDKLPKALPIGLIGAVGGAVAGGLIGIRKKDRQDDTEDEKTQPSYYKMYVKKDFGNVIKKDGEEKLIYARIAEILPDGREVPRDDLSAQIQVFSGDGSMEVSDAGVIGGCKAVRAKVALGCASPEGQVSFTFTGHGGTFIRHVVFKFTEAQDRMLP